MSNFTVFQNTQFDELIDAIKTGGGGGGSYTLPPATAETLGGVKVGNNLTVTEDGTLNANSSDLPIASSNTLGGVKVGTGLAIESDGKLSVTGGGGGGSSLVFSTNEQEVGVWIDGKKLYQITLELITGSSQATLLIPLSLPNIDSYFIDGSHSYVVGSGTNNNIQLVPCNVQLDTRNFGCDLVKVNNVWNFRYSNRNSLYLNRPMFVTIQYTKN